MISLDQLESKVYNYSISIIGFMMTLKKEHLNNAQTSEIVKNAGSLNTYIIDAHEFKDQELKLNLGQCLRIADILYSVILKLETNGKFNKEKESLQIETAEIINDIENLIKSI